MPINDAIFLLAERREQPMHVGGLQLFRLPRGAGEDWLPSTYESIVRSDVGQVAPLFRRRPHRPLSALGAWSWESDPDVDLEHHVRLSALPRPGRVRELLALASRLHGSLLDRHRPLWEVHLIDGLEGDRFALYTKVHHALLDGVSALRLLARSLTTDPQVVDMPMPFGVRPWRPPPVGAGGPPAIVGVPLSALRTACEVADLGASAGRRALESLVRGDRHLPTLAPRTIFNQPITGARRFAAESWPMSRFEAVADAAGTTINDVLLATCGGALRAYLADLGALPDEPLVAMTPVSLRQAGMEAGGNAIAALLCNLGTDRPDPADRLKVVHESMEEGKARLRQMTPVQATITSAAAMSPMVLGMIPGLRQVAGPAYNVVISNVPGPKEPLYWNGALLEGVYPMSIPADGQALNITVTSYAGNLEFGPIGCRRTVPHLQRLLAQLEDSLQHLEQAVRG